MIELGRIDIPNNPNEAYNEGWLDVVGLIIHDFSELRDGCNMPANQKEQKRMTELTGLIEKLDQYRDIQASTARWQKMAQQEKERVSTD